MENKYANSKEWLEAFLADDSGAEEPKPDIADIRIRTFTENHLSAPVRVDGKVMSRREWYDSIEPVKRVTFIRKYANKKRNGCYAELSEPRKEYAIMGADDRGAVVPLIIYSHCFGHLPEEVKSE